MWRIALYLKKKGFQQEPEVRSLKILCSFLQTNKKKIRTYQMISDKTTLHTYSKLFLMLGMHYCMRIFIISNMFVPWVNHTVSGESGLIGQHHSCKNSRSLAQCSKIHFFTWCVSARMRFCLHITCSSPLAGSKGHTLDEYPPFIQWNSIPFCEY